MSHESPLTRVAQIYAMATPGDADAFATLESIAADLHAAGNHFAAGYAWEKGVWFAWGTPAEFTRASSNAAAEYLEAAQEAGDCTSRGIAAMVRLVGTLTLRAGSPVSRAVGNVWLDEIANRMLSCDTLVGPDCLHLVRGLLVRTDFAELIELVVPTWEVDWGLERGGPEYLEFAIPSPFQLFIETGDYAGAARIASECPEAFTTPGLRGWRAAVRGFTARSRGVEHFAQAASQFALDVVPEGGPDPERGHWTSRNLDLWAPYFRARSLLALAVREPLAAGQYITAAAQQLPLGVSGWEDADVQRFRALVACLARLIDSAIETPIEAIEREFVSAARWGGPAEQDPLATQFITLVSRSLRGFAEDPAEEITRGRLSEALALLDRLPLMEPGIGEAARRAAGERMLEVLLGPTSWVYKQIEAIRDERVLQRLVLRLARVALPAYAQVLHGPLEHGKDVVVLLSSESTTELRMYQVKAGDIATGTWRVAKQELEAMFEVPVSSLLSGIPEPDRLVGFLVTNGHPKPAVVPEMEGWFATQRDRFGRDIQLMHLDDLVRWIRDDHLLNEFRSFLVDEGLN